MPKTSTLDLMEESLGSRVKAEREARGWSQQELATRVVRAGARTMSQAGIHKIESKGHSEPKSILPLAKALGVSAAWLQTGRGEKSALRALSATLPDPQERQPVHQRASGEVVINELDVHASAGMGADGSVAIMAAEEAGVIVGSFSFPATGFREMISVNPDGVRVIAVRGDSMQPTLWPGQRVFVDTNDRTPSPPGVFVVWDGLALVLKRIELLAGTEPLRVRISSDNDKYTAYERTIDEAHINGRVIGVWARM